ncbi:MAG: hypothetical protein J4G14_11925 [Dehalococcoidia bacterium]|nr:hypothetical protein [Dehalococcoidia bacterium]
MVIVAVIAALVFAIACASEEPEPAPALDAAEIQKSVAAVIAAQPAGLTRADVESIVSQSSEGHLSAADVKEIVDQSVRALPAPEIDVSQLSSLVNSAVADAVPEGVSADEISRIVYPTRLRAATSRTWLHRPSRTRSATSSPPTR